jgi:hypothetical protein
MGCAVVDAFNIGHIISSLGLMDLDTFGIVLSANI